MRPSGALIAVGDQKRTTRMLTQQDRAGGFKLLLDPFHDGGPGLDQFLRRLRTPAPARFRHPEPTDIARAALKRVRLSRIAGDIARRDNLPKFQQQSAAVGQEVGYDRRNEGRAT